MDPWKLRVGYTVDTHALVSCLLVYNGNEVWFLFEEFSSITKIEFYIFVYKQKESFFQENNSPGYSCDIRAWSRTHELPRNVRRLIKEFCGDVRGAAGLKWEHVCDPDSLVIY